MRSWTDGGRVLWELESRGAVSPLLLRYGTVPEGTRQVCPLEGVSLVPLREGEVVAIKVSVVGDTFLCEYKSASFWFRRRGNSFEDAYDEANFPPQ